MKSYCNTDCDKCPMKESCGGCIDTNGRPFGGACMLAQCCRSKKYGFCGECGHACALKEELIAEFNALGIEDMEEVTGLNALHGAYINLQYTLSGGQKIKFWEDDRIYLGNQICKKNSNRCYGLTADENYLLVCEYGDNGSDAEIVLYKRRRKFCAHN